MNNQSKKNYTKKLKREVAHKEWLLSVKLSLPKNI